MFSMSSKQLDPAYTCGTYHRRGRKWMHVASYAGGLSGQHFENVRPEGEAGQRQHDRRLEASIRDERRRSTRAKRRGHAAQADRRGEKNQLKVLTRQKIAELMRKPDQEEMINETYDALEAECYGKIRGLESQLDLMADHRNNVIRMNRIAKTALDIFDDILNKPKLKKAGYRVHRRAHRRIRTTTRHPAQERH